MSIEVIIIFHEQNSLPNFSKIQERVDVKRDHETSTNSSETLTTSPEDLNVLFYDQP